MESDLWSLLNDLLTRTVGHSVTAELEKFRSIIPEAGMQLLNIVSQADFFLNRLEERHRQKIISAIIGDIYARVEHIFHYSASCLRVCCGGESSNESVITACRVALQESWYTDTGSPSFSSSSPLDSLKTNAASCSVVYLSPAAPSHLRRWLSLNLCCSNLLITILPAEDNGILRTVGVAHFERIIQNDLHLGRRPLLLIAYAEAPASTGSMSSGVSDCLPALARICHCHKMWLHVEGLSFHRMALLTSPSVKPTGVTTINSINLELSLCLGLPRPLSIVSLRIFPVILKEGIIRRRVKPLLMQSRLPDSILLYLNIFPLTTRRTAEEKEGETSLLSRSLPSTCLADALFAWFALRIQGGNHVARLRHADHLTAYALKRMECLPFVEIVPSHWCSNVTTDSWDRDCDTFIRMLCDTSVHSPIILFRYAFPLSQDEESVVKRKSSLISNTKAVDEASMKERCLFDSLETCVDRRQDGVMEQRFVNSLNQWVPSLFLVFSINKEREKEYLVSPYMHLLALKLASALQVEYPSFFIKTHVLSNGTLVLRFSLLDSVNLMAVKDADVDALVETISLDCSIMEATWKEKPAFCKLINGTPGLYYYHLPDWAGLGAVFYVPHTYRCLLPDAGEMLPWEYQNLLSTSLLRLPAKAAHDICELNRELISRLRSHDYAFSSARVTFNTVPGFCEALENLASTTGTKRSSSANLVNGGGESNGCGENGGAAISHMQFHCLRFGLITPGTDTSEMVQMVLRMANVVEEDSSYVNSLSEVVKWGIEEATLHMKEERTKIMREQGVLRQVPYLDKLINWWSPLIPTQIHGQMLNLSIGELVATDSIRPVSSSPPVGHDQTNKDSSNGEKEASASFWSWLLPFSGTSAS
ncbi:unnamed protein product [Hydatigera taeniaeformis]|uniref:Pyridoxal-dependent decarboxylase domain-containing protein 1 n=1 Tax=Hydatigena taeniaeformis TaxID=6205 RepID=A0A0R3X5F3_HYDTA|nr:unnamed protein product [Hydatigera taeniaeformis]